MIRIRRASAIIAALALLPIFLAASASAAAPSTTVSMTYMNASNTAPMAGAHVVVYYMRPAPRMHATVTLPQLAMGTADASGAVNLTLDTSAVPKSPLADVGTGPDAFNALIVAWDSAGQYNITQAVIQEGHTFSYRAAAGTDPATGRPAQWKAATVASMNKQFASGAVPATQVAVANHYRYSPITPLNDAPGLHATLKYTFSTSTQTQSEFELPTTEYGGVNLTNNQTEQNGRTTSTGIHKDADYHRWAWADYYYILYQIGVGHGLSYLQWEPDHFQGTVTDYNKDFRKKGDRKPIGHLAFKQPAYNPGPGGNWAVPIGRNSEPFTRSDGKRLENSLGFNFTLGTLPGHIMGGGVKLQDLMTYGSITWASWKYEKGCPRGHTRVVFAYHTDPVAAGRILAACVRGQG